MYPTMHCYEPQSTQKGALKAICCVLEKENIEGQVTLKTWSGRRPVFGPERHRNNLHGHQNII